MIRRSWVRPSVLAAALLAAASGHAQQTAALEHPTRFGLDAAWQRQPENQSLQLRRDATDAARRAAQRWTQDAPALGLATKTDRVTGNEGSREYDAGVSIPLWLPGERARTQAVAEADGAALDARLAAARLRLAEQVRTAYWEHARAVQEFQLAEARLKNATQLADDVGRRLKAGDLAQADAHQANAAVAAAEATVAESRGTLSRSSRRWQAMTGLGPLGNAAPFPERLPPAEDSVSAHPELLELTSKVEVAKRHRDLASSQRWANPELSVGAIRERAGAGERYERSVTVGIRIPLGASSSSQARIATAGAEQLEAETTLALETRRIQSDVASSRDEVMALRASADAADRRARLASESRGFFEKSFRLGESDLPTRLRVELEAFEAERQAARVRTELAAAISKLRQALGLLPE